jgi:Fe-S-cluster containining protein
MSRRRKRNRPHLPETKVRVESAPAAINPTTVQDGFSQKQYTLIEQAAYRMRVRIFEMSRSAGNTITSNELEGGSSVQALVDGAAKVSAYADEMIETIKRRHRPALDCKEGCAYCCRKPGVLASIPELLRVLEHVQLTFNEAETRGLAQRARGYAAQMEGRNCNAPVDESVPCPLLVNERCSVYEVRPLVCRGYNSTSVDACRAAHDKSNALVPIFAPLRDVTDGATVGLGQQLKSHGLNDSMVDLGRALNIAFTAGENFQKSIAEGDPILAAAENKDWAAELLAYVRETARRVGIEI